MKDFDAAAFGRGLQPLAAIVLIFLLWETAVWFFDIPTLILPPPSAVFANIWKRRVLFAAFTQPTLLEVLSGFFVATVLGISLAVLVSFTAFARRTIYPLLVSSQMIPKVAIAPIFIIWFGTGLEAKVLIAFLIAFFPIMISTMVGLESVEPDMVSMFRSMGAGPVKIFTKLRFPAALPNIFAGLKVGMSLSVVGAIVAEFVAADRGLGYYLIYANGQLDTTGVFASLLLLTVLGVVLYYAVEAVQRLFVPGALSQRADPAQATM